MKTSRETPASVCDAMLLKLHLGNNMSVLEPSAGTGTLVNHIENNTTFSGLSFDLVELNENRAMELSNIKKSNWQVYHADFLTFAPYTSKKYHRIIAAPPFKANVDIWHIVRMYERFLKRDGYLVSLTSPLWMVHNEKHQIDFRKWLADKDYSLTMVPDNSFIERGRTVPTAILQIHKS